MLKIRLISSKKVLFTALLAGLLPLGAQAASRVSLVGIATFAEPDYKRGSQTENYNSRMGTGFGGLLEINAGQPLSWQVGMLYVPRVYDRGVDRYRESMWQFPVLARANFSLFSFGFGPYIAMYSGDIRHEIIEGDSVLLDEKVPRGTYNRGTMDYGLVGSVAGRMPLNPGVALLFDLRYTIGLSDNDTTPLNELKFNDVQIMGGFQFQF